MYSRCQCLVSGSMNGTGVTRCGARVLSSSPRSRSASRTSPKSFCSRYRRPPCTSLLDREEVPEAKSRASTSATFKPRVAASRAAPVPVAPPPMTTTSKTSFSRRERAARRCSGPRRLRSFKSGLLWGVGVSWEASDRSNSVAEYIGAIDQGTTSTRFIVFDSGGNIVTVDQREHEQITPKAGWVEHDAKEVWTRTREVIGGALANSSLEAGDIAAVGITNQRETTVVWDRETGEPVYNAIVWQDTRTDAIVRELGDADQLRDATGLPLSTYFAGPKIKWILDNVDGAREKA